MVIEQILSDLFSGSRQAFDMRLLLVEDDLEIASFIMKGLKQSGFAVGYAADGEDGLHLVLHMPYDIV